MYRRKDGFQLFVISVPFSSGSVTSLLYCTAEVSECDFIVVQSVFLRMGGAEVCIVDVMFHHRGLLHWKESGLV